MKCPFELCSKDLKNYYNRKYNSILAAEIGIEETLVLLQIYEFMLFYYNNPKKYGGRLDFRWWVKFPVRSSSDSKLSWSMMFPEFSLSKLINTFRNLEELGYVVSRQSGGMDRTKEYSVNVKKLLKELPNVKGLFSWVPLADSIVGE